MTTLIECPTCNWQPDGEPHWTCTCGYSWNTFETRAQCPKCNTQWETTSCPGCGKSSPRNDWYFDSSIPKEPDTPEIAELKKRKKKLEERLISLGIKNYRVSHLSYLDYSKEEFQRPYEVGCRLIILNAISYSVHNLDDRPKIIQWLKKEKLWEQVSNNEINFLNQSKPNEDVLLDLSWKIESSILLGWVLNLFDNLHDITQECSDDVMDAFESKIPELGAETKDFLRDLKFRPLDQIYEENLLNELVTTYFRDLMFSGKSDETQIDRVVSFERHQALNWLRKFQGINEWDDTDTST